MQEITMRSDQFLGKWKISREFPPLEATQLVLPLTHTSLHFPQKYAQKRLNLSFQRCNCVTNGEGRLCTLRKSNLL